MTIPRSLRKYIEAGRLDEVESEWLTQIDEDPSALGFFAATARALKGAGEEHIARTLLELLWDELQGDAFLEERLTLLREVGLLLYEPQDLHEEMLTVLRRIYRGLPNLEGFIDQVGLHRAIEDVRKSWQKVANLRGIMRFEIGSIVWMKGKGAGRVTEVNFDLGNFKIDFERSPGLRVGFGGAGKLMQALPEEHLLRRKIEAPEALLELKKSDPGELLLVALRSYDQPRSATQVRESLAGIVDEKQWSSWWSAARKNPQVLTEGKGARQLYRATASSADAEEAVVAAFDSADTDGKLEIFRRNAGRNEELHHHLAGRLAAIGEASAATAFGLRFAIAHALRDSPELASEAPWAPHTMVAEAKDATTVIAALTDRGSRERAYELVREIRPDWLDAFVARLEAEEDPKLLEHIAAALADGRPEALTAFYDRVLAHPRKLPAAFVWLAERAQGHPDLLERRPLRLIQALLTTSHPRELEPFLGRLRKLLEDGGPIARLIQYIEPDQAASTEELLKRSTLQEYLRKPLIDALHMRFPDMREDAEAPLYATFESIAKRQADLEKLREVEIPANRRAIQEAREMGDLRENFEYKAARQRHEYLAARQATLMDDLARAQPLDLSRTDANEVRVATRVTLDKAAASTRKLLILGPWESAPENDIISYDSDLARALLGKALGDTAEFAGDTYEIVAIEPWHGDGET
ncbi:MAG: GreA/GreB family elongation factor [Acidobacteria bacterium]|nr:GreA/GreB family elongation factor [Acidobacteriota bacterium]